MIVNDSIFDKIYVYIFGSENYLKYETKNAVSFLYVTYV